MEKWHHVVHGILDDIFPGAPLDDALATRIADALIHEPLGYLTVEEEFAALQGALREGGSLAELTPPSHSEAAVREFLSAVLSKLEAQRPWPEPAARRLHPSEVRNFPSTPIARVGLPYAYLGMRLGEVFWPADEAGSRQVLVLRLASGAELALVAPWWDGSDNVAVLLRGPGHLPRDAVAELVRVKDLSPEDVEVLA